MQQVESSRLKLAQIEQELQQVHQQGVFVAIGVTADHGRSVAGNSSSGALTFDMDYARWVDEHQRLINGIRSAINSQMGDNELHLLVDSVITHYDELYRLKRIGAKADMFHILSGLWITPAERCFMWLGGNHSSELLKIVRNHLDPLTDQQLMGIYNLQRSSQQAEDALSQGTEAEEHNLLQKGWCPYFLARHMVQFANVVVYSYQYLLDPKVAAIISKEMQKESVVVFDEAHNIDNVCIEALSVSVRRQTIDGARRNINRMRQEIDKFKATDAGRLRAEYNKLVEGLALRGDLPAADGWLVNPALPDDILKEAVPGNIRKAEHFVQVLRRLVQYLEGRLETENVEKDNPVSFVSSILNQAGIDQKTLKFCYDRLHSLMMTLEITDTDEFLHVQTICDFATLVGTYARGFSIIIEPFDERMPHIPDPVLQLCCHDASLAIRPVLERFQSVVIPSGTLSPIDLYPRLLNFHPIVSRSFTMSLTRDCICPYGPYSWQ